MLPEDLPMTPQEIELLLDAAGYTQEEAALALKVKQGTISKWRSGHLLPGPQSQARLRGLKPRPGRHREWATYVAEAKVRAQIAARARQPNPDQQPQNPGTESEVAVGQPGPDEVAARIVGALPGAGKLARLVSMRVAGTAQRLATGLGMQLTALLQAMAQLESELGRKLADLETLVMKWKNGLDALEAKVDGLGNAVQDLHVKADALERGGQKLQARADSLAAGVVRALLPYLAGCTAVLAIPLTLLVFALLHAPGGGFWRCEDPSAPLAANAPRTPGQAGAKSSATLAVPAPDDPTRARAWVSRPVPKEPLKGQMRPPCGWLTPINGGCWLGATDEKHNVLRPPCPEDTYESEGYCFVPMGERGERLPSTLDGAP